MKHPSSITDNTNAGDQLSPASTISRGEACLLEALRALGLNEDAYFKLSQEARAGRLYFLYVNETASLEQSNQKDISPGI